MQYFEVCLEVHMLPIIMISTYNIYVQHLFGMGLCSFNLTNNDTKTAPVIKKQLFHY
jgi:hypothetical protein